MRILFLILFSVLPYTLFANSSTHYTIAADQNNGMITVLTNDGRLLYFGYYDWGPNWSGIRRNNLTTEEHNRIRFNYKNIINQTNAEYEINGFWEKISEYEMRFEANLIAKNNSDIVQAQFSINTGELLNGERARVYNSENEYHEVPMPFESGLIGNDIIRIDFIHNTNIAAVLKFDQPVYISADRNEARIAIVKEKIEEGNIYHLNMTLIFNEPLIFYSGPESAPDSQYGWYPFSQDVVISEDSHLSLSSWLDGPAGKYGRIMANGDNLYRNDQPIKIWGINLSFNACAPHKKLADKRAEFYAAMGINSIRCHKYAQGPGWRGITSEKSAILFDEESLDRFDYFISALKNRGIYTKLSPVFIINPGPDDASIIPYLNEFERLRHDWYNPKHGSIYFSPELQELLVQQFTNLLSHRNPYTGLTYAEDPAIIYIEIYNEDSIFFHGTPRALSSSATLRTNAGWLFSQWLKEKYSTESEWRSAWGNRAINSSILRNQRIPTDESWAENRIYPVGNPWFFDPDNIATSQKRYEQRLYDTMEFLYQHQNNVYAHIANKIRETGYTGELISSNWIAGRQMSHFYNLHSDKIIGTIDRHNYFGGGRGPYHSNSSMLSTPGSGILSSGLHQVEGRPFMLSEWIHVSPNEWASEGAAIISAYGMGLQGWDASYAFQNSDAGTFSSALRENWDVTAPNFIGLFPAISRQVLRQDVKESQEVHYLNIHIPSLSIGDVGFDLRDSTSGDIKSTTTDVFSSEALSIMRSQIRFTEDNIKTTKLNIQESVRSNTYNSVTNELTWKPGQTPQSGYIVIDTAATQAVVGFAQNQPQKLSTSEIELKSKFGAVYLTAQSYNGTLDNDDLLIVAIGRARNHGASIINDNFILSSGSRERNRITGPVLMEPVVASIRLNRTDFEVIALDHNGNITENKLNLSDDGSFHIDTGEYKTPYFLVKTIN